MGFFSWNTCDTGRTIANKSSSLATFKVHMITPDGRVFTENDYNGYGIFGGKDFYELLGELNGLTGDRDTAIDLCFKENPNGDDTPGVIYPKFVENLDQNVVLQYKSLPNPDSCEFQGFFYPDDEDEDGEDDWGYDDEEEEYEDED